MNAIASALSARIAGRGGAGFFIEPVIVPADDSSVGLGIDVSLLSPDRLCTYLARRTEQDLSGRLGDFLYRASVLDEVDEAITFQDTAAGLLIDVTPVDEMTLEMEVRIAQDLDDDVIDFDGLNFETERAAVLVAAETVRAFARLLPGRGE